MGKSLAIETSGLDQAMVLLDEELLRAPHGWRRSQGDPPLMARITVLFREVGWAPSALQQVAVARGPGSFTGLRIGLATGMGIAYGQSLPLYLLDSLEVLAARATASSTGALRDAGRREVYAWRRGETPVRLPAAALSKWLRATDRLVVEPAGALAAWSPDQAGLEIAPSQRQTAARGLAARAIEAFVRQKPVRYHEVQPLYVAPSAAEERKVTET